MANVIDCYLDQYHKRSNKEEKTALAANIVTRSKSQGVRFLSRESGVWKEVSDVLARGKVSQMFRRHQHNQQSTCRSQDQQSLTRVLPMPLEPPRNVETRPTKRFKLCEQSTMSSLSLFYIPPNKL